MLIKNKYSLTYCSNIFKENNWKTLFNKLNTYINSLKKYNKPIGLSLCISNKLSNEIKKEKNISTIKNWLEEKNVYLSSINGFVYKTFHKKNIKDKIHYPDWTSKKKLNYTTNLITILRNLITKNKTGSISSSPLSYAPWIKKKNHDYILFKSSKNIAIIIKNLICSTNKNIIHIDIEPEPDCIINDSTTFINFYNKWLIPIAVKYLNDNLNFSKKKAIIYIKKHIRLCYDICHFSVNFENHKKIIHSINKNNIKIGKVQISSAMEIKIPTQNTKKAYIINDLKNVIKSPFLHQTTEKINKKLIKYKDIKYALKNFENKNNSILRIHCHTPLYKKNIKNIGTTQNETKNALIDLLNEKHIKHIEIETYTHKLISNEKQLNSIIKEYNWVIKLINKKFKHEINKTINKTS